jgi:two-component system sensor histidine kinase KdpD
MMPAEGRLQVRAGYPPEDTLDDADLAAAQWTWDRNHAAGRGADTLPGAKRLFLPIRTERGPVGVIGIDGDRNGPLLTPEERRLLDALLDQIAVALERIELVEDLDEARILAESEKLRSALLTSLSHDLRTPLAAILGAATSLQSFGDGYDPTVRAELAGTIRSEAERLNRFVGNLLDMTRLEAGVLQPRFEPVDLMDVVGTALENTSRLVTQHRVVIDIAPDLPLIQGDFVLLEQVVINLIDNAAKYAPTGTEIRIEAAVEHDPGPAGRDRVIFAVADEGPGIPPEDLETVFAKFYRARAADRQPAGTGLGLAIGRGFVEAMGGTIRAGNRPGRAGAVITVILPALKTPVAEKLDVPAA